MDAKLRKEKSAKGIPKHFAHHLFCFFTFQKVIQAIHQHLLS